MKWHFLLAAILLPVLLTGCFGGMGTPLPDGRRDVLQDGLEEVDRRAAAGQESVQTHLDSLKSSLVPIADSKDRTLRADAAKLHVLIGYCRERLEQYEEAVWEYEQATGSEYSSVAYMRVAQVAEYRAQQEAGKAVERWEKQAVRALERAANFPIQMDKDTRELRGPTVLLREPPAGPAGTVHWLVRDVRHEAHVRLDKYYKGRLSYRIFDFLVRGMGGKNHSYLLAIVVIAALAKLITLPLSASQFRSMQAMQALQPELKKIQEKHKGDKQQLARAQMALFKERKISPASSCLPMLIQMPILIWVYYGIRSFVFRFEQVHFLYLDSLANPDVVPIGEMLWPGPFLLVYGLSMYFSQKLLATPAATPEQQQQQKLMAYMMPVLLVLILKGLPAAFILYWLLQNILMTGHQYFILRRQRVAQALAGGGGGETPAPPESPPPAPPPEALDRLSQGTKQRKKKKKRR